MKKIVGFSKKKTHFSFSRDESNSEVSESLAYGKWEKNAGTRFSVVIPKCTFVHKKKTRETFMTDNKLSVYHDLTKITRVPNFVQVCVLRSISIQKIDV